MSSLKRSLSASGLSGPRPRRSRLLPTAFPELKPLNDALTAAMNRVIPSSSDAYANVIVISMSWKQTDVKVQPAKSQLMDVLRKDYGYSIHDVELDNSTAVPGTPQRRALSATAGMVNNYQSTDSQKKTLFIIYYSGHATMYQPQNGAPHLQIHGMGYDSKVPGRFIIWDQFASGVFSPDAWNHCLVIMDCCHAGMASLQGNQEIIAASSWESTATNSASDNFTIDVTNVLKSALPDGINAANVVQALLRKAGQMYHNAQPVHRPPMDGKQPSVFLAPLKGQAIAKTASKPGKSKAKLKAKSKQRVQVVLKFIMADAGVIPDEDEWVAYLQSGVPRDIGTFKLKTKWKTVNSTLYQVSVPFEVWCCLEDIPEFDFVGYEIVDGDGDDVVAADEGQAESVLGARDTNIPQASGRK